MGERYASIKLQRDYDRNSVQSFTNFCIVDMQQDQQGNCLISHPVVYSTSFNQASAKNLFATLPIINESLVGLKTLKSVVEIYNM